MKDKDLCETANPSLSNSWMMNELVEIENLDVSATSRMVLHMILAAEEARRNGLTYEDIKKVIIDRGGGLEVPLLGINLSKVKKKRSKR